MFFETSAAKLICFLSHTSKLRHSLPNIQLGQVDHPNAQPPKQMQLAIQEQRLAFVADSARAMSELLSDDEWAELANAKAELAKLVQEVGRRDELMQLIGTMQKDRKFYHVEEREIDQLVDWEALEALTDQQIVAQLQKCRTKESSNVAHFMKKLHGLDKSRAKLESTRHCIGALLRTLQQTNIQLAVVQLNHLQAIVQAMNQLVPFVHRMGGGVFRNAAIQLFLIYQDEHTSSRCAVEGAIQLVHTQHHSQL